MLTKNFIIRMISRKPFTLLVVILGLMFNPASSQAGVYKCTSADGQTTFQDRPCASPTNPEPAENTADSPAEADSGKHFLWKASSNTATVHLLGSIHFGSTEIYPLPGVITDAYDRSDTLVVEVNADEQTLQESMATMVRSGTYPDGTTLQDHVTPELWEKVAKTAVSQKLDLNALQTRQPWLITLMLATLAVERSGFSPKLGIDRYFITGATGSKPIVELESVGEQMQLLSAFSELEQSKLLEETLDQLDQGPAYFRSMLAAWQNGNAAELETLIRQDMDANPETRKIFDRLFTRRNHTMAEKIIKMSAPGKSLFVVVGAGHMVGDEGIVELLRANGYTVIQL